MHHEITTVVFISSPASLREEIRDLLPLREKLVLVSEQCEKRVLDLMVQERDEIRALKKERQSLQCIIERMNEQQSALQIQVELILPLLYLMYIVSE